MIPAGQFTGAPGAGLGAVKPLIMPAGVAQWPTPFNAARPLPGLGRAGGRLQGALPVEGPLYAVATLAGAALGGALLGWVAADSREGAKKGAAFAAGLTGVSSGMATWQSQRLLGATLVVSGLGGMLWAVRDRLKRR
jgi:hypothetical protein